MASAPAYTCTLSAELLEKAKDELNEKEETREKDVQVLREKVIANKALTCPLDDGFLLRFMRARKFDQERAYQLIVNYYTLRAENLTYFKDFTPSALHKVLDSTITMALPKAKPTDPRVLYFRPGSWNPDDFNIWEVFRTNALTLEKIIAEEDAQVNGIVMIGDMGTVGWNQAKNLDRAYAGLFTKLLQDAFPCRFKGIHIVNEPSFFSIVFAIVRPFLKAKLASRFHFHASSLDSLHEHFPVDSLPEELGGKLGPADGLFKTWNKDMLDSEQMYKEMTKYKIEVERDISAGQGQTNDAAMAGLTGTYKKLSVD